MDNAAFYVLAGCQPLEVENGVDFTGFTLEASLGSCFLGKVLRLLTVSAPVSVVEKPLLSAWPCLPQSIGRYLSTIICLLRTSQSGHVQIARPPESAY